MVIQAIPSSQLYSNSNTIFHSEGTRLLTQLAAPGLQTVDDSLPLLLVSLVFRDPRFPDRLGAVGVGRVPGLVVYCHFHDPRGRRIATRRATMKSIITLKLVYDGLLLACPLPSDSTKHSLLRLSFSSGARRAGSVLFPVLHIPEQPPETNIAACVAPLHGSGDPLHLVTWMEMNRLLGVTHFYFYNFSVAQKLLPALNHYQRLGLAEMLPWHTDPVPTRRNGWWPPSNDGLHYYGQFASNTDCLYRAGNRHRYIIVIDLDEILLPRSHPDLMRLLNEIDAPKVAQFQFRNSYVRSDFPLEGVAGDSIFLRRVWREQRLLPEGQGSKVALKFMKGLTMGVHELSRYAPGSWGKDTRIVLPANGILLHYRDPPRNLKIADKGTNETVLLGLLPRLRRAVETTMKEIENKENSL